jgi:phospholipid transport system substrate-binding protein
MLTRRSLLVLAGTAAALATFAPRSLFAQDSAAAAFVQDNGNRILALAPNAQNDAATRATLLELVNRVLDVDGIGRFALGPYSRQATPDQMQRYLQLFHQVISNGVTARLAAYQDTKFTIGRSDQRDGGTLVHTTIVRPGSPPADVDWLVGNVGGQMLILDVIAEGTSLRQTERSDYTSYLQSHGGSIDALLSAIQAQVSG